MGSENIEYKQMVNSIKTQRKIGKDQRSDFFKNDLQERIAEIKYFTFKTSFKC